ncbi:MAG TPA: hypothetical protein VHE81_20640, partial [Lacipirellulaceae bacterium]|nr:hypothetical protein [Lacipirellulaceae bacterium]
RATENSLYPMTFQDQPPAPFLTNTFLKEDVTGQHLVRVFWSWYNAENKENKGKVEWEAPHNARWHFGNTRALFKMYFTSMMRDANETAEQSACVRFAREFLPVVNKALEEVYNEPSAGKEMNNADADVATKAGGPKIDTAKAAKESSGEVATSDKAKQAESKSPDKAARP